MLYSIKGDLLHMTKHVFFKLSHAFLVYLHVSGPAVWALPVHCEPGNDAGLVLTVSAPLLELHLQKISEVEHSESEYFHHRMRPFILPGQHFHERGVHIVLQDIAGQQTLLRSKHTRLISQNIRRHLFESK